MVDGKRASGPEPDPARSVWARVREKARRIGLSRVTGPFLLAAVFLLLLFRFYVYPPLPRYEAPAVLTPGTLGSKTSRLLVFAPHSDDEALAAAGLIDQTLAAGGKVKVVLVTNGDGFTVAAEEELRTGRLTPRQYVELGYIRQGETLAAMAAVGLPAQDVIFLGYPDRGVAAMWERYWDFTRPFRSRYTGTSKSPYNDSFTPEAPYCGRQLVNDIEKIILGFQPTEIVVSHPSDAHPDHWAVFAFVTYALEELRTEGFDPDRRISVWTYLVHRGDWPLPRGYHPADCLDPPRTLVGLKTRWYAYPLGPQAVSAKHTAIDRYRSQTTLMPFYLRSFIRKNELFGVLPEERAAEAASGRTRGTAPALGEAETHWWGTSPVVLDPVDDTVFRRVERSADLVSVYAAVDGDRLFLLAKARGAPSPEVQYSFLISDFGARGDRTFYRLTVTPPGTLAVEVDGQTEGPRVEAVRAGCRAQVTAGGVELAVGLGVLEHPDRVFISVESLIGRRVVDRTEWTVLGL